MEKKSETSVGSFNNLSEPPDIKRNNSVNDENIQANTTNELNHLKVLYTNLEKRVEHLERGLKHISGIFKK